MVFIYKPFGINLLFVNIIKQIIYCMLSRSSEKPSDGIGL